MEYCKAALSAEDLKVPKTAWRVDPAISGGGLFHDLAPHQLDLMYHLFGGAQKVTGITANRAGTYAADDLVAAQLLFKSRVLFSGLWNFNTTNGQETDQCEITGTKGSMSFSIFDTQPVTVTVKGITETFSFDKLDHVQQPMIEQVVACFLDKAPNPCSGMEGAVVMQLIDAITRK